MSPVWQLQQKFRSVLWLYCIIVPVTVMGQSPISSIAYVSSVNGTITHTNIKGAGLRNPGTTALISLWDSTGSSFTVKFNAPATANTVSLTQFSVAAVTTPLIKMPVSSFVKLRRASNPDVGDARKYYNFWGAYSGIPADGAASGSFDYTVPEVLDPDDAFQSNNLTSGYDNLFSNSVAYPHFGNIERVDFVIPSGLKPINDVDRTESGAIVIDRGVGDPFKIAAITAINGSNDPTAFGPLVSVLASDFGGNLMGSNFNYGILISDINFNNGASRPSNRGNQNLRGVYISLQALGIANNQRFYGYALFGEDVTTANLDWTTYPNNTGANPQLDPVNVLGMFKSSKSVLSVPVEFTATQHSNAVLLQFNMYNKFMSDEVKIERSEDGINFTEIGRMKITGAGQYRFEDTMPKAGNNLYRLYFKEKAGPDGYSSIKKVEIQNNNQVVLYPVPAKYVLNITLPGNWENKGVIAELWNQTGQRVRQKTYLRNEQTVSFPLQGLDPGYYYLHLKNMQTQAIEIKTITVIQ
jgi:hypothetical protein